MRDELSQKWKQLSQRRTEESGVSRIRLSAALTADVFVGLRHPEQTRLFLVRVPKDVLHQLSPLFVQLRGIRTSAAEDTRDPGYGCITLALVDQTLSDLFDTLVEDLATSLEGINPPIAQGRMILQRLEHWRDLFARYAGRELSPLARQGLFGELKWIHSLLDAGIAADRIIESWQGSPGGDQDFIFGDVAAEVKTTAAGQRLFIDSERQLDDTGLGTLILVHQVVEAGEHGVTLADEVRELRSRLSSEPLNRDRFEARLAGTGYSDIHEEIYSETRYRMLGVRTFRVEPHFPCLRSNELPSGISSVRYSIDPTVCEPYAIATDAAFEMMR
jgi:hypothetical protein